MEQRISDPFHLKDDGMKAAIAACPITLPRVDRDRLAYPFEVKAGQLWGLVDVTMEGQRWLFLLNKSLNRSAPCSAASADEIQIRPVRGRVHHIDRFIEVRGLGQVVEVLLNRSPLSQIDMRINDHKLIRFLSGPDVGRALLGGPWGVEIVHLLIIFRSKGCWRDKRISDQVVTIFEPETLLIKVDHLPTRVTKEIGVSQVPVSGNEEDPLNPCCPDHVLEEGKEILFDKGPLVRDHVLISLGGSEGGKEVTA